MSDPIIRVDALMPPEIARKAEEIGYRKVHLDNLSVFALAVLAGAFVSLGGIFSTTTAAGMSSVPYGIVRLLAGVVFSLGLILVVVGGAELFTGNTLIVMAWASGKIKLRDLLRNWTLVYVGNFVGSILTAILMFAGGQHTFGHGAVGITALTLANTKVNYPFVQALALGILCNGLVCLAVWLTMGARTTSDKIVAIIFPIAAFVAAGFEHSVANMYFIPYAILIKQFDPAFVAGVPNLPDLNNLTLSGMVNNLIPVTIGNIIGGGVLVAAAYWFIYLRPKPSTPET
ncbi:MAG: formate/nitrite transporter family protein [Anaerolinea sp.]|nr:formate/nitrite transporter family protein [Anaerolinea sp.]MCC6976459.1 formate transporter FocA [Anaerolineae bacterium]CAG1007380.1 putative formate transporter 1 [Anaerolineae bacterium]